MFLSEINEEDLKGLKNTIEYYRHFTREGITSSLMEKQLLEMLNRPKSFLPFFPLQIGENRQEVYRLTVNKKILGSNKRIRNLRDLKYPPKDKVTKYGRCNIPLQSVLYGTFDHITMVNEVLPKPGSLVTVSHWKAKKDSILVFCPIFLNQPTNGTLNPRTLDISQLFERELRKYPESHKNEVNELYQFFTDEFSKRVGENDRDYLFSAFYSNKILSEAAYGTIDAIRYPSVQQNLSFENIVIKATSFDLKYDIVEVYDGIIDLSGRFISVFNTCKEFNTLTGEILWSKQINWPPEQLLFFKQQYGLELD